MVRINKILFLLIFFSGFLFSAPLVYLSKTIVSGTALEYPTTIWKNGGISIGFNFPFNGLVFTDVFVSKRGYVSFTTNGTDKTNETLPYAGTDESMIPYWDDLDYGAKDKGYISSGTFGIAPNRYFVLSWVNMKPSHDTTLNYSFEMLLYEDGSIRYRYEDTSPLDGLSATIGTQESTLYYDQHSYNSTFDKTSDILYQIKADMSILKNSIVLSDGVSVTNPKRIPGAILRYCFDVSNTGVGSADNVTVTDILAPTSIYINSGYLLQDISLACSCSSILDISGSISGTNISINMGTLTGSSLSTTSKGCGYIEVELQ